MTRELVWTGFTTLDGRVDSPGGENEGHPGGGWVFATEFLPEAFALKGEELQETSALMFGKRSYDVFAPVWKDSADHADFKEIPKYLVSTTATDADVAEGWGETTILRSTDDVAAVKDGEGGAIFIHGSAELGRRLSEAGLIDRYHLLVFPWLLGSGKSVFSDQVQERRALRLRETDSYANGVVKLVYEVVR